MEMQSCDVIAGSIALSGAIAKSKRYGTYRPSCPNGPGKPPIPSLLIISCFLIEKSSTLVGVKLFVIILLDAP